MQSALHVLFWMQNFGFFGSLSILKQCLFLERWTSSKRNYFDASRRLWPGSKEVWVSRLLGFWTCQWTQVKNIFLLSCVALFTSLPCFYTDTKITKVVPEIVPEFRSQLKFLSTALVKLKSRFRLQQIQRTSSFGVVVQSMLSNCSRLS